MQIIEPDWPAPPGVKALCTTRVGGRSAPPYDTLNLARHVGDDSAAVDANRRLLDLALPDGTAVQWLSQVHGSRVVQAPAGQPCPRADALWTRTPGVACAVLTADCLPVLFCSSGGDRVAAAHAGWRGLLAGVLEATVAALGADGSGIQAWLGPAIGPRSFEVGPEVRQAFMAAGTAAERASVDACFAAAGAREGHFMADLYGLARLRLARAGVARVFGGGLCTCSDPGRFYSYRRDGETGRMASLILICPD